MPTAPAGGRRGAHPWLSSRNPRCHARLGRSEQRVRVSGQSSSRVLLCPHAQFGNLRECDARTICTRRRTCGARVHRQRHWDALSVSGPAVELAVSQDESAAKQVRPTFRGSCFKRHRESTPHLASAVNVTEASQASVGPSVRRYPKQAANERALPAGSGTKCAAYRMGVDFRSPAHAACGNTRAEVATHLILSEEFQGTTGH